MKRRLLRICTALALCLSLLPTAALAAENGITVSVYISPQSSSSSILVYGNNASIMVSVSGFSENQYESINICLYKGDSATAFKSENAPVIPVLETATYNFTVPLTGEDWKPGIYTITAKAFSGSTQLASTSVTMEVKKADQPLSAPTASKVTSTSVTLNTITGQGDVKYACVEGESATVPDTESDEWKDSTEFTNLQPATAYTFFARCAGNEYYNEATSSAVITTDRADSALTVESSDTTPTYGETLTITVTPSIKEQTATNALTTAQNTVELYNGDELLAQTSESVNGVYTLTCDTKNKGLTPGQNALTVSFGGSGSLNPSTATVTVMLEKKDVDATLDGTASKTYDGTTAAPAGLTIELTGVLEGDDVTAAGTIAYDTKDVGNNKRITASDLTLTGADAGYYNLTSDDIEERTGSITAAVLGGALTITGTAQQGQTLTANYTPVHDEQVTYQWNRGGTAIPEATGSTYTLTEADIGQSITVTATATDDNHTGSVTSGPVTVSRPSSGGSGSPARYRTEVPEDIEGGAVAVSPARAARGRTVTLTVTPDGGWQLDRLTVRDSAGGPVELTRRDDGTYTFTMPRGGVEIGVSFVPVPLPFDDVPADHWAGEAIRWACAGGYLYGTAPGLFAPDSPVTRQQLAAMLYRFAMRAGADVSVGEDTNILSYADAFDVAEYAIPAMQWACGAGVIGGTADGRLNPAGTATRAHLAAMLQRFRAED